jgi:peptidoglycan/LPS O-acetylase OafA/YrhL
MIRHRSVPPTAPRLSELDALRGIAALLVVLQHARVMGLDPRPFDIPLLDRGVHMLMHFSPLRVLEFGRPAVLFFFVLSGYVLTRALLRGGSPGLLAYAAQRSVRLMVPVAASVAFSALLYALFADPEVLATTLRERTIDIWQVPPDVDDVLRESALLLTMSDPVKLNPVLWSLVHEWRLTLLLPLVLLFRGRIWWLLALGCAGMALGAMASGSENRVLLGEHFHSTLVASLYFSLAIASGAALAFAGPLRPLAPGQRVAAGIASLALFGLASDVANYLAAVLLIVVAQQPGGFQRFLRRSPLVWLGSASYSLYLVHAPVLVASMMVLHGWMPLWACLALGVPAALLAAEAMRRLVEVPSRALAHRVERRLRRRHDAAPQAESGPEAMRWGTTWAAEGGLFLEPAGVAAPQRRLNGRTAPAGRS